MIFEKLPTVPTSDELLNKSFRRAARAKHMGNVMLFIIDPCETCGYTLPKQMHLLEEIKKEFGIPMIVAVNKTDISAPYEGAEMSMSTLTGDGVEAVLERLIGMIKLEM